MLTKIKLLTYYFNFSRLKIERDFPQENSYTKALSALYWLVSYILAALFFALLLNVVDYDVIVDAWPYDFGREYGKNFIAPSAVFFLMVWYLIRRAFIASFLNEKAIVEIKQFYRSESIEQKEHDYLINIDTFLFFATTTSIVFQVWPAFMVCFALFSAQEVWIRKRFSPSKSQN
ncbi:hypothetical protein O9853_06010 [Vibrio lentus]|nr:hypothetical protein [Vibrio lentus]MCZ8500799.1 hypothetical protein [Vibrio lentus]PMH59857.1 hypothetical protein BCU64_21620 [Vibrio lentus]